MPTVHRGTGFRFAIFPEDHDPAHVHAIRGKGKGQSVAKVQINGDVVILYAIGFNPAELRKIFKAAVNNQKLLLAKWNEIHG
jgi:hypothetical protein